MNENILICRKIAGENFPADAKRVFAIGVFDGVHLGHCAIVGKAAELARPEGAVPAALTFVPHPRALFSPGQPPELLSTLEERCTLLLSSGAQEVWAADFTRLLAALPPEEFMTHLRHVPLFQLGGIAVGENWRFGCGGKGNAALLDRLCRQSGIPFAAVPLVRKEGVTVSSSAIRDAVRRGDLTLAEALLGRPFAMTGTVVHGFRDATAALDCPTANLETAAPLPPDGVYYGIVQLDGQRFVTAADLGFAPTFDREQKERRIELHLLDAGAPDLYGRSLTFFPRVRLREERRFDSVAALKQQIAGDLDEIRHLASHDSFNLK